MVPDLEESLMPLLFGRSAKLIFAFLLIRDSDCEMMTVSPIHDILKAKDNKIIRL